MLLASNDLHSAQPSDHVPSHAHTLQAPPTPLAAYTPLSPAPRLDSCTNELLRSTLWGNLHPPSARRGDRSTASVLRASLQPLSPTDHAQSTAILSSHTFLCSDVRLSAGGTCRNARTLGKPYVSCSSIFDVLRLRVSLFCEIGARGRRAARHVGSGRPQDVRRDRSWPSTSSFYPLLLLTRPDMFSWASRWPSWGRLLIWSSEPHRIVRRRRGRSRTVDWKRSWAGGTRRGQRRRTRMSEWRTWCTSRHGRWQA